MPNCPLGHRQTYGIFGSFNEKHLPWPHGFFEQGETILSTIHKIIQRSINIELPSQNLPVHVGRQLQ